MSLPVLDAGGTAEAQGAAHGEAFAGLARHNLEVYLSRLELEAHLPPPRVREMAARWLAVTEVRDPDFVAGMRGIALGSGLDLLDVAVLNGRYELLYSQFGIIGLERERRKVDGCTAFAIPPRASANGHALIGQNWDWIPEVKGVLVRTRFENGSRVLAFTEAGIFGGKIGLNDAGLGLAMNGLTSTADAWDRDALPLHARTWRALRARTL
ncbi:MAG TPA: C45 family peptidase, partial [Deinococcales bacterium]|nr:C45 family peptidase [Deinococcales bacterium]